MHKVVVDTETLEDLLKIVVVDRLKSLPWLRHIHSDRCRVFPSVNLLLGLKQRETLSRASQQMEAPSLTSLGVGMTGVTPRTDAGGVGGEEVGAAAGEVTYELELLVGVLLQVPVARVGDGAVELHRPLPGPLR